MVTWWRVREQVLSFHLLDFFGDTVGLVRDNPRKSFSFSRFLSLYPEWSFEVARKGKSANGYTRETSTKDDNVGIAWRNIRLSEDTIPEILEIASNEEKLGVAMARLLLNEWGLSVKLATYGKGWAAYAISPERGDGSPQVGISGYADSACIAAASCLYKVFAYQQDSTIGSDVEARHGIR